MEIFINFLIVVLMLLAVIFIGCFVLTKDNKDFHIKFSLTGFEISGSFFED